MFDKIPNGVLEDNSSVTPASTNVDGPNSEDIVDDMVNEESSHNNDCALHSHYETLQTEVIVSTFDNTIENPFVDSKHEGGGNIGNNAARVVGISPLRDETSYPVAFACQGYFMLNIPQLNLRDGRTHVISDNPVANRGHLATGASSYASTMKKAAQLASKATPRISVAKQTTKIGKPAEIFTTQIPFKATVNITYVDAKHIYIDVENISDYNLVYFQRFLYIGEHHLRFLKRKPDFVPGEETPLAPIWIILPLLPWHCYHWETVKQIVEQIGVLLSLEKATMSKTRAMKPKLEWRSI
ncbi:hypothetical protein KY285_019077 [Solanum tuberosum]|nr:hypothetical protein KY285_019077 [Solanum tuberosum]